MVVRYYITEDLIRQKNNLASKMDNDTFFRLVAIDPTYNGVSPDDEDFVPEENNTGKFIRIILKLYNDKTNDFNKHEDKIKELMNKYFSNTDNLYWTKLKQFYGIEKNDMWFKSIDEFISKLESIDLEEMEKQKTRKQNKVNTITLYDASTWIIQVPLDVYASVALGAGTQWCVSYVEKDESRYEVVTDPVTQKEVKIPYVIKNDKGQMLPRSNNYFLTYCVTGFQGYKPDALFFITNKKTKERKLLYYPIEENEDDNSKVKYEFNDPDNSSYDLWKWLYKNKDTITNEFREQIYNFTWTSEMKSNAKYSYENDVKPFVDKYYNKMIGEKKMITKTNLNESRYKRKTKIRKFSESSNVLYTVEDFIEISSKYVDFDVVVLFAMDYEGETKTLDEWNRLFTPYLDNMDRNKVEIIEEDDGWVGYYDDDKITPYFDTLEKAYDYAIKIYSHYKIISETEDSFYFVKDKHYSSKLK